MNVGLYLILTAITLIFLVIGFFTGLKGFRFTLVKFILFVISFIMSLIFMGPISKFIVNVKIINGQSINQLFKSLINNVDFLSGLYAQGGTIKNFLDQLPNAIMQILSYTITLAIFTAISNIVYKILATFLPGMKMFDTGLKNEKEKSKQEIAKIKTKIEEAKTDKEKRKYEKELRIANADLERTKNKTISSRSKIFGGLLGVVYGFVMLVVIALPISGVASAMYQVTNTSGVNADNGKQEINLNQLIFKDASVTIEGCLQAYKSTPLGAISNIGNLDVSFLRKVTRVELDGKKIDLIDNVKNMSVIYDDIEYLINFKYQYEDISSIDNLDISKIKNIAKYFLQIELVDNIFNEFVDYTLDYIQEQNLSDDLKEYVTEITKEIDAVGTPREYVEQELYTILDTTQVVLNSKVITNIANIIKGEDKNQEFAKIVDKLLEKEDNGNTYIKNIIAELGESNTINITSCFMFNKLLATLENIVNKNDSTQKESEFLGRVPVNSNFGYDNIGDMVESFAKIFQNVQMVDFSDKENRINNLLLTKKDDKSILLCITEELGKTLDSVLQIDVLNVSVSGKTILDRLCEYLPKIPVINTFINLEYLQDENIVTDEITNLNNIINMFINSEQFDTMTQEDYDKTQTTKTILEFLNAKTDNENNTYKIVNDLLSTKLFRNVETFILTKGVQIVNNALKVFFETVGEFPEITTTNMFSLDKLNLAVLSQNATAYFNSIYNKENEMVYNVVKSNYADLGLVLDCLKNTEMFGYSGYYNHIITLLDNKYGEYINFDVTKEDSFSWVNSLNEYNVIVGLENVTYGEAFNDFLNEEVTYNEETYILFDVLSGKCEKQLVDVLSEDLGYEKTTLYVSRLEGFELFKSLAEIMKDKLADIIL